MLVMVKSGLRVKRPPRLALPEGTRMVMVDRCLPQCPAAGVDGNISAGARRIRAR